MGDRSKPPTAGKMRRMGASTGSVTRSRNNLAGWREFGATQLATTDASKMMEQSSITKRRRVITTPT